MIKLADLPRYLLYAETELEPFQGKSLGRWRFILQSLESPQRFDAEDWEPGVSLERLELLTVIRGLEELDQPSAVTVLTESKYVVHGFDFGLREWRQSGWRWEQFGDLIPITNDDLWRRFDRANQCHQVQCRHRQASDGLAPLVIAKSPRIYELEMERTRRPLAKARGIGRWVRNLSRVASSIIPM